MSTYTDMNSYTSASMIDSHRAETNIEKGYKDVDGKERKIKDKTW